MTTLRALVARVPGILWVVLLAAALLVSAVVAIERAGERRGEHKVAAAARHDTTTSAIAAVDTATARTDRVVAIARRAKARSDTGRAQRELARIAVAAALDSTPPTVVELLHTDDALLQTDSVTIAQQADALSAALAERAARQLLDTARVHERDDEPPEHGLGARDVAAGVGVVAIVVAIVVGGVQLVRHLLGR